MECHHYDEFWGGMHCIACEQAEQIARLEAALAEKNALIDRAILYTDRPENTTAYEWVEIIEDMRKAREMK